MVAPSTCGHGRHDARDVGDVLTWLGEDERGCRLIGVLGQAWKGSLRSALGCRSEINTVNSRCTKLLFFFFFPFSWLRQPPCSPPSVEVWKPLGRSHVELGPAHVIRY